MISKTKYEVTKSEMSAIFAKAELGQVKEFSPLGEGEFNAAYLVHTTEGEYVLKIAPPKDAIILSYEKEMMRSELFWYEQIREHTSVKVPTIYFADESRNIIPCHYFIMEKLEGKPLSEMTFSSEEQAIVTRTKISMAGQIHRIQSDVFGYVQHGTKATWYDAISEMVGMLLEDTKRFDKTSPYGERLLQGIQRHKELLTQVPGTMVNFDLWDSNVFCHPAEEGLHFAWIDPERSFFGDPLADFITCGEGPMQLLSKKDALYEIYEEQSGIHVEGNQDEDIRYAVALGYLALIMETERYNRYEPGDEGWERNTVEANEMFEIALAVLEA